MQIDYRETIFSKNIFPNVENEKGKLLNKIRAEHPKAENFYNLLGQSEYRTNFMGVYHCKCAYCGVSIELIPASSFEIDHIIPKSSQYFQKNIEENANCLENLALACRTCNRNKSDFELNTKNTPCLHPDKNEISSIFVRDEKYYIRISENYRKDELVKDFYKQVGLGSQVHRLDYILMNLFDLRNEYPEIPEIDQAITILMLRRNYLA